MYLLFLPKYAIDGASKNTMVWCLLYIDRCVKKEKKMERKIKNSLCCILKCTKINLSFHYSEPCLLDCGIEGVCDNSKDGISRCLCPFGKSGNKCEEGKIFIPFMHNKIDILPEMY